MASQIAITVEDTLREQLEALAVERSVTPSDVASEAVAAYLADNAAFRAAVEEGLAAGRAGDFVDFEQFSADLRRRMEIRVAESDV
jgi:predicted transcriptional regulator